MRRLFGIAAMVALIACSSDATGPADGGGRSREGRGVLFIGNSYLYVWDIPGMVQALADSGGDSLAIQSVVGPNLALIDHWNLGTARTAIAKGGWEWVVLQQGPSSVQYNRDSLRLLTGWFDEEIRAVDARTALFSAWPAYDRSQDFPRAIESYRLAAEDVGGLLLPVAAGWVEALEADPAIELYGDLYHPSEAGAYLSAIIVYSKLVARSPIGLPRVLDLANGYRIVISEELAATLQSAAYEALQEPLTSP